MARVRSSFLTFQHLNLAFRNLEEPEEVGTGAGHTQQGAGGGAGGVGGGAGEEEGQDRG